ncbi:VOC family protein [Nonomuraea sp. NPDC048826]|uniref:VOC family protein n=1 Tax=Nonomuraea sp. NPDC048826 TaxID=3364347 RepID=UPI0037195D49
MKLEFLFVPTSDLKASLGLYRDSLGFTERWREGDTTVALGLPGTDTQLMLDAHDPAAPVAPVFVVDSLDAFHAARPETLTVVEAPAEIPGGFKAAYQDPGGATIIVMDQSADQSAGQSAGQGTP